MAGPLPSVAYRLAIGSRKRSLETQASADDAAVFELFAGDLLRDLGYEVTGREIPLVGRTAARLSQMRLEVARYARRLRNHDVRRRVLRRLGFATR